VIEIARAVNDLRDDFEGLGYDIKSTLVARGRRVVAARQDRRRADGLDCVIGTPDEVRQALAVEAARRQHAQ
jgi:hypothetical protein